MNKTRRQAILKIINTLEDLKSDIEYLRDEEDDAKENMPESLWETERYEQMEEAVDNMDQAVDSLDDVIGCLTDAI